MFARPDRSRLRIVFLWAGAAAFAAGALVALVVPAGGSNRVAAMALPLGIGAAALAVNAVLVWRRLWVTVILYVVAALISTYGLLLGAEVPLRLAVEGRCDPAPAPCPLGFERPLTGAETIALEVAIALGLLGLLLAFVAIEVEFRPRLLPFRPRPDPDEAGTR